MKIQIDNTESSKRSERNIGGTLNAKDGSKVVQVFYNSGKQKKKEEKPGNKICMMPQESCRQLSTMRNELFT